MAEPHAPNWIRTSARAGGMALLCYVVLHAAATIALRIGYPYQIEWNEGTSFLEGVVLREQGVLYPDPHQAHFVPHIYTPLHAGLVALLTLVTGNHLPAGRALSVAATVLCAAVSWRWARECGAPRAAALAGALSFLAVFRAVSQWFDLVRVDMVFLLPFTLGLRALFHDRAPRPVAGALWLAVAYLAKQTPLFYGPPLVLWLWWRSGWRDALRFAVAFGLGLLLPLLGLHLWTHGWSTFYLFTAVGGHGFESWGKLLPRAIELGVFLLPPLLAALLLGTRGTVDSLLLALLSAALSALAYVKHGGYENAWLPLCIGTVPAAALLAARLPGTGTLLLGVLALFLHLKWDGWQAGALHDRVTVPAAADREALDLAVQQIAAIPGPVWVADDPWVGYRAGKGIWPLEYLCNELGLQGYIPGPVRQGLAGEGPEAFQALVFAEDPVSFPGIDALAIKPEAMRAAVARDFLPARHLSYQSIWAGRCRVGVSIRPGAVYERRPR
jgi:hypothetical protein